MGIFIFEGMNDDKKNDYLSHHGVEGQKWGVRNGPPYPLYRQDSVKYKAIKRVQYAAKTKKDVDDIVGSLNAHDKDLLEAKNGYLSIEEGEYVLKRILLKEKDTPVAFFDILTDGTDSKGRENINLAMAVRNGEHGKGYGAKVAKKGSDWLKKHRDELGEITWSAHTDNAASRHLAEKNGFVYDSEHSDEKWANYGLDDR